MCNASQRAGHIGSKTIEQEDRVVMCHDKIGTCNRKLVKERWGQAATPSHYSYSLHYSSVV